ncbi:hypothetical protein LSAT2_027375 [Lamellibrachia satsuma]|nr:hypothetical protein LSAT2_027375 [Lamellibrachia satsuma]
MEDERPLPVPWATHQQPTWASAGWGCKCQTWIGRQRRCNTLGAPFVGSGSLPPSTTKSIKADSSLRSMGYLYARGRSSGPVTSTVDRPTSRVVLKICGRLMVTCDSYQTSRRCSVPLRQQPK